MIARFESSGTHVHNGILKVRVDLYPSPSDKTYSIHYVDHYDREPTEEELADEVKLALVPKHKEITPCLCHFIQVDENITPQELRTYIQQIFDRDSLVFLDDELSKPQIDIRGIGILMRGKTGKGKPIQSMSKDRIEVLNKKLASLEVVV